MKYKVQKGDTLSSIAKAHNISLDELLQLNGISKDKANNISVGQEIKIGQPSPSTETPGFRTPALSSQFAPDMTWQPTPKPEDSEMGTPYAPGYTRKAFVTDNAKTIQKQLVAAGYNVGRTGADGKWGKNSQAALDKALAEGYTLKGNQLVKPTLKSRKPTGVDPTYLKSNALTMQQQLKELGYDLGTSGKNKDGVDGSWGGKSQTALDKALADGYIFKDGKLVTPEPEKKSSSLSTVQSTFVPYGYNAAFVMRNQPKKPTQEAQTTEELQQLYQQGPGSGQVLGSYLYHIIAPKSWSMPHSDGLKDQVAAGIKYSESLPDQEKEADSTTKRRTNADGSHYIGYNTWGTLAGQSGNVNEQGNAGNGASKILGGLRYKFNEDGSVDVTDVYGFNIIRDFSTLDGKGRPVARNKKDANDPYMGHPWKGLWHDLNQPHSEVTSWTGLQHLAENFGTRQGKTRTNNIHYDAGEITTRTSY